MIFAKTEIIQQNVATQMVRQYKSFCRSFIAVG